MAQIPLIQGGGPGDKDPQAQSQGNGLAFVRSKNFPKGLIKEYMERENEGDPEANCPYIVGGFNFHTTLIARGLSCGYDTLTLTTPAVRTLFIYTGPSKFKRNSFSEFLTLWTWAGRFSHIPDPLPASGDSSPDN
ncbi:hypothetical protein O181_024828 [Austropuccinia psidii MF-1]|uniref:Uncharacterized protein n=1 Tax=Austropuccinia psidii MF-1 TaxID=1389203 RepID=A0A9Q3CLH8_9BASI|nr:hypothetical protein [Austropuccinia psidii MF-1]